MRTRTKLVVIVGAALLLAGAGGVTWFVVTREKPMTYWFPTITQENPHAVVGEGTTILAAPEKDTTGSLMDEIIGKPVRVTIRPQISADGSLTLTFSGIIDYAVNFQPGYIDRLITSLDDFDAVAARVTEQKRFSYQQRLGELSFQLAGGPVREIPLLLRSTPERSVKRNGFAFEEGQVLYLRLNLPFPLEDTTNFTHTEVNIPQSGVRHFRELLRRLRTAHEKRNA